MRVAVSKLQSLEKIKKNRNKNETCLEENKLKCKKKKEKRRKEIEVFEKHWTKFHLMPRIIGLEITNAWLLEGTKLKYL